MSPGNMPTGSPCYARQEGCDVQRGEAFPTWVQHRAEGRPPPPASGRQGASGGAARRARKLAVGSEIRYRLGGICAVPWDAFGGSRRLVLLPVGLEIVR